MAAHRAAAAELRSRLARLPQGERIRLGKPTSNLFRFREDGPSGRLDAGGLDQVISVDVETRTAFVQGLTTYERLVEATLEHDLMPLVVPQLKTITVGGAVAGLGIESSSFKHGLAHESVLEAEVLTGDGRLVTATADNEHAELFRALPNSYGTLGYAVAFRVQLQPVGRYVSLRHPRFRDAAEAAEAITGICKAGEYDGEPVDFCDGTVFDADEQYLTLGRFTDEAPPGRAPSDYTGQGIYYRSVQRRDTDLLTTHDYLWRWDTDWFWCSRALGAQHPLVRRLWPRRYRRSDVYRRLVALDRRAGFSAKVRRRMGLPPEEPVIQDIEVPVERLAEFLDSFHSEIGISPVWLCPVRLRDAAGWSLYPMDPSRTYVNVGFWSAVPLREGQRLGDHNRRIERIVADLEGHKSLYSDSYYSESEFWASYNGERYRAAKRRYDPDGRLPDLYEKCVRGV